ncbi:MAG: Crp/Fnr family transcriptional regulator, partial [Bacteroidota bacterium]
MAHPILAYFNQFMALTPAEEQAIMQSLVEQRFPKGHVLLEAGQVAMDTYFVVEGFIRQYYMVDGEEKTTHFYGEGQWVFSNNSYVEKQVAPYFLVCMEGSTLVVGKEESGQALLESFPRFQDLSRIMLEQEILRQQKQTS